MYLFIAGVGILGWISYKYHITEYILKIIKYGYNTSEEQNMPRHGSMRPPRARIHPKTPINPTDLVI